MKKVDVISLTLSVIINFGILFALAYRPFVDVAEVQSIKIGLVSLDTNATTKFEGKENKDANKSDPNTETIQQGEQKETLQVVDEKKEVLKEAAKESEIVENVIEKEVEKIITEPKEQPKPKPSLKDLKKSIAESKPSSKDLVKNTVGYSPNIQNNDSVDRKIIVSGDSNGLVSGSINGTAADGEVLILWGKGNRNPIFPDNAKVQGKTGTMLIKIQVNEAGAVVSYLIEKGSGVPEIDLAVEKVIGSWNLKMKRKNKIVAGVFYLDYKFDFK